MEMNVKAYSWCNEIEIARMPDSSYIVEENRELCQVDGICKSCCDQEQTTWEYIAYNCCNEMDFLINFHSDQNVWSQLLVWPICVV